MQNTNKFRIRRLHLIGAWLFVGLLAVGQSYVSYLVEGRPAPPFARTVLWQLPPWLFWAFATNPILALGRRFPLERSSWARALCIHVAAATVLAIAHNAVYLATSYGTEVVPLWLAPGTFFIRLLNSQLIPGFLIYAAILGVGYAMDREQLERQLVSARLDALRMQLQPHFLFNALNTTAVLVRETGSKEALRVVLNLSDLLRAVLDENAPRQIALHDEIELLRQYLEIESIRFADRLRIDIDVDDDAARASVPRLILQPLVENAIRHGIARLADGGTVRIRAFLGDDVLRIIIANDGPPLANGTGSGLGLRNVRERLERTYARADAFTIASVPNGVEARIEIPWNRSEP